MIKEGFKYVSRKFHGSVKSIFRQFPEGFKEVPGGFKVHSRVFQKSFKEV